MTHRRTLNRLWLILGAVGLVLVLFSGVSYTVYDSAECPATWQGDTATFTEVLGSDGEVVGYWCLVEGSIGRDGTQNYLAIPVGEAKGYPGWYGFIPMIIAGIGYGLTRVLARDQNSVPEA